MGIVAAKCPQCGANIKVDEEKDAGICEYCGTPFITEKAINNYNTYVTNNNVYNFAGATVNLQQGNISGWLRIANDYVSDKKYHEADSYYRKVQEIEPDNINAIFGRKLYSCYEKISSGNVIDIPKESVVFSKLLNEAENDELRKFMISSLTELHFSSGKKIYDLLATSGSYMNPIDIVNQFAHWVWIFDILLPGINYIKDNQLMENPIYIDVYSKALDVITRSAASILEEFDRPGGKIRLEDEQREKVLKYYDDSCVQLSKYAPNIHPVSIGKFDRLPNDTYWTKRNATTQTVVSSSNNNSSSGGCYIATCVYGSYDCPEVWTLRRFRDFTLDSTWYGRAFIKCYYAISPTLVKVFGDTKWFKKFWKYPLDKMVGSLKKSGVKDTYYVDKY